MKVRLKRNPEVLADATYLNMHALNEVIINFDDGDADSMFFADLEVFLEATKEWKFLPTAIKDHDVITDNFNTRIFEPANEEDRQRGYAIYG